MRNWASRIDEGDKDKNKGKSAVRNKVAEREKKKRAFQGSGERRGDGVA